MGRGVSKGRPLILRLQSIKLLNFNLILVDKSKVKISYSGCNKNRNTMHLIDTVFPQFTRWGRGGGG